MAKVITYQSYAKNPKVNADFWKNQPTEDAFLIIDVEVPEGFELAHGKGLTYFDFKPNSDDHIVRIHLYAKPIVNECAQNNGDSK